MRIFLTFILAIITLACNELNGSDISNEKTEVEILNGEKELDIHIFSGGSFFKNKEADRLNSKGVDYIKKNKYKEAEKYFIAAYRLEPENPTILNNLGNIYREIGTEKMALEYYTEALIASDSTYFNAAYNMGISYCNIEEYEKSEKILNYIISNTSIENEKTFAEYVLIRVYVSQQQCKKATELYTKIKSELDKFPQFRANRENLEIKLENCIQIK